MKFHFTVEIDIGEKDQRHDEPHININEHAGSEPLAARDVQMIHQLLRFMLLCHRDPYRVYQEDDR